MSKNKFGLDEHKYQEMLKHYLCKYSEYGKNSGFPSMKDDFHPTPYEGMAAIAAYLKKGQGLVAGGATYDAFNPDRFICSEVLLTDGEFEWFSSLSYYIETYNLRFSPEIETRLLEKIRSDEGENRQKTDVPGKQDNAE